MACVDGLRASSTYEVRASSSAAVPAALSVRVLSVALSGQKIASASRRLLDTEKASLSTDTSTRPVCGSGGARCVAPAEMSRLGVTERDCVTWVAVSALARGPSVGGDEGVRSVVAHVSVETTTLGVPSVVQPMVVVLVCAVAAALGVGVPVLLRRNGPLGDDTLAALSRPHTQ